MRDPIDSVEAFNTRWAGSYRLTETTQRNSASDCVVYTFEQASPFGYWVDSGILYIGEGGDYDSIQALSDSIDNYDGGL